MLFNIAEIRDSEAELISIDISGFKDIEDVEPVESILFQELKIFESIEKKTIDGFYENEKNKIREDYDIMYLLHTLMRG
ncbi:MAG: hypothetical protein GX660_10335 [Clostridiaceae bacterium]|nr:hypothetical protein [Clostridiaceae bacterium]